VAVANRIKHDLVWLQGRVTRQADEVSDREANAFEVQLATGRTTPLPELTTIGRIGGWRSEGGGAVKGFVTGGDMLRLGKLVQQRELLALLQQSLVLEQVPVVGSIQADAALAVLVASSRKTSAGETSAAETSAAETSAAETSSAETSSAETSAARSGQGTSDCRLVKATRITCEKAVNENKER
jgi:hypothetical protein